VARGKPRPARVTGAVLRSSESEAIQAKMLTMDEARRIAVYWVSVNRRARVTAHRRFGADGRAVRVLDHENLARVRLRMKALERQAARMARPGPAEFLGTTSTAGHLRDSLPAISCLGAFRTPAAGAYG
jgi:hypothetical protein